MSHGHTVDKSQHNELLSNHKSTTKSDACDTKKGRSKKTNFGNLLCSVFWWAEGPNMESTWALSNPNKVFFLGTHGGTKAQIWSFYCSLTITCNFLPSIVDTMTNSCDGSSLWLAVLLVIWEPDKSYKLIIMALEMVGKVRRVLS